MNELITACLVAKNIQPLAQFPRELMSEKAIERINYIMAYTSKFDKPPTIGRLMKADKDFVPFYFEATEWESEPDPLMDLYQQTVERKFLETSLRMVEEAKGVMDDTGVVPVEIFEELQRLHTMSLGISKFSTFDRELYFRRKSMDFPFKVINRYIGGLSGGDFMLLIGRLGTGKSTVAQWLAKDAWEKSKRILYASGEMLDLDIFARIDAMVGHFNPLGLRGGTDERREELRGIIATTYKTKIAEAEGEIIVPKMRFMNANQVASYAKNLQCDLVIVDGVYLMSPSGGRWSSTWEKVAGVSNELKQSALELDIPLIGVTQIKRGATGDVYDPEDIAYSDALGQDADFVVAIKPNKVIKERADLQLIKNRYGSEGACSVWFDFDTMTIRDETVDGAFDGEEDLTFKLKPTEEGKFIGGEDPIDHEDDARKIMKVLSAEETAKLDEAREMEWEKAFEMGDFE